MKILGLSVILALGAAVHAQTTPRAPQIPSFSRVAAPTDAAAIPLYSGTAPGSEGHNELEVWDRMSGHRVVRNVTRPTMTAFLPVAGTATGAAVVVVPGGGFKSVAIEIEGWPTARWLAAHGVAAFVLKYRVNRTPDDEAAFMQETVAGLGAMMSSPDRTRGMKEARATDDILQALRLVRAGASEWAVDPARVGVLGFSAGAIAAFEAATIPDDTRRPAFVGTIYGPMAAAAIPANAPPLFAAIALDDPLFGRQGFGLVESWRRAGGAVELHAYEKGGHGFGTGRPGTSTTLMLPEFLAWLGARGLLEKPR